jgi:hypothetical protein
MITAVGPKVSKKWPHRLGKKPARHGSVKFLLMNYFNLAALPHAPEHFRCSKPPKWIDYGNSDYGDCVWSGFANQTALEETEGGYATPVFTTNNVLSDYSAVTGFDRNDKSTDVGTDIGQACAYRRKTGIVDSHGYRHKTDAYCWIHLQDAEFLKWAMWTMGGLGLGFRFPGTAMTQFDRGKVWEVTPDWKITGGHYVPAIGIAPNGNIICVSWGKEIQMTVDFYMTFADEVIAFLDLKRLAQKTRLSPEGFNEARLREDLKSVSSGWGVYS